MTKIEETGQILTFSSMNLPINIAEYEIQVLSKRRRWITLHESQRFRIIKK